jgi:hypothetical protein
VARKKHVGLYTEVAIRAMEEALHERLIDRCWDQLKQVFEDPKVQQAEAVIMRAIAEAFVPNGKSKPHRKK